MISLDHRDICGFQMSRNARGDKYIGRKTVPVSLLLTMPSLAETVANSRRRPRNLSGNAGRNSCGRHLKFSGPRSSKFCGIAAAGRPIIAIAAKDGEIAKLVNENDCGAVIEPGDAVALSRTLLCLAEDPQRCVAMGCHARAMLEASFTRQHAFQRWDAVFDNISHPNGT